MENVNYIKAPKGLENVIVDKSSISVSDPEGKLIYRGYSIDDLANNSFFEEVAYLILKGHIPTHEELIDFISLLKAERNVPQEIYDLFEKLKGKYLTPIDMQKIGVALIAAYDESWYVQDTDGLFLKAIKIISKLATVTANGYRIIFKDLKPVEPSNEFMHAENFLYMLTGTKPNPFFSKILDITMILYMDHDFNASTFTTRAIASTLSDIYSAILGGLSALKGPLHGGANEKAAEMVIKFKNPEEAEKYILESLAKKEKIMGFGHRVYKKFDPRSEIAKKLFKKFVERYSKFSDMLSVMEKIEEVMKREKDIPSNVDFWIGPLYYAMGIDIPLYTPIFALSRVVGWSAHYIEQITNNKLIRPKAEYVGPLELKFPYKRDFINKL
jgi:citrate synthase